MSRIKGITIELDGETRGLDKALSDVNKRSRDVQTELRQVERLLKFNPGNTELVAQKQKLLGDQVETTRDKLDKLKDAEAEVQAQFEKGEISEDQYRAFQREIVETESKLKHYEQQLEQTQSKLEKFSEKTAEAGQKLKDAGEKMTATGKDLSKKVTAPLVGAAAIAVKVGSDFEAGMSKVAAVSGATGDDLQKLEDKAREMGSQTSFSATEAANGLEYMALAGWDTQQMIGGLEPVLHLAEAGALDLGRASDLVTDSMAALGLEVDDLDGYLDQVAETSRKSNTDIDALMEAMVVAGGTFSRFNVPLDEANAFLGVLANRGTKGTEAGTALNAIMDRLTSGTGQAATALDELGISAFDSEGNFKGMEATMMEVNDALSGMDDEQKAHYQSMIAGLNHGKSFEKMLQGLDDEYIDLKDSVGNADGALEDMRDTMKDNLQGRLEEMKSSLEEVGIIIYDNLKPALESLVELITKAAEWFQNLSPAIQNTIVVIAGIAAAIGPLLIVFGMVAKGFGSLLLTISKLTPIIAKIIPLFKLAGAAIAGISAPVWGIIAGITALIAAGIALWKNWDTVKEKTLDVWGSISEFFADLWETLKELFSTALEFINERIDTYWEAIGEGISTFWEGLVEFFENIWEIIKNIFVGAFLVLMLLITGQWEEIGEVTSDIWENITEAFIEIWESIKQIFSGALEAILGFVSQVWEDIKEVFNIALEWLDEKTDGKFSEILETVTTAMNHIWEIIKSVWTYVKETFSNVLSFLKALVTGDFEGMKNAINSQMQSAKTLLTTIWNSIKGFFSTVLGDIWGTVRDKFQDIKDSVSEKMYDVLESIKSIWDDVMAFFNGIDLTQIGKDMISGLVSGIKSMGTELVNSAKGVVDDAIEGAKNLLKIASPSKVFVEMGEQTGEGFVVGMNAMGNRVKRAGERMAESSIPETPRTESGGSGTVNHIDMRGLFEGANFSVRSDQDIEDIAKKLHDYMKQKARSQGVVY